MIYIGNATDVYDINSLDIYANTCSGVENFPGNWATPKQVFASVARRMYIIWRAEILIVETTSHLEQIWLHALWVQPYTLIVIGRLSK